MSRASQSAAAPRHRVNWTLLLVSLLVIALLAVTVYFWHGRMMSNISSQFLAEAQSLVGQAEQPDADPEQARQSLQKATDLLWQYRRIHPEDAQAIQLLAQTFDQTAQGPRTKLRAAELYTQAIAQTELPDEQQRLRLRRCELLLEGLRFQDAQEAAQELKQSSSYSTMGPEFQATVDRVLAQARDNRRLRGQDLEPGTLLEALQQAIQSNPQDTALPSRLASIYRDPELKQELNETQLNQLTEDNNRDLTIAANERADQVIDALVERNPQSGQAHLTRYLYRRTFPLDSQDRDAIDGFNTLTARDLAEALRLAPQDPEIRFEAGQDCLSRFDNLSAPEPGAAVNPEQQELLDQAAEHFEFCTRTTNEDFGVNRQFQAYLALGRVQQAQGNTDAAVGVWSDALEQLADQGVDIGLLTICRTDLVAGLVKQGEVDQAKAYLSDIANSIDEYSLGRFDPRKRTDLMLYQVYAGALIEEQSADTSQLIGNLENALSRSGDADTRLQELLTQKLASLYQAIGQSEKVASTLSRLSGTDSKRNREVIRQQLQAYSRTGQWDEAVSVAENLVRNTSSAEDWLIYATVLRQREQNQPVEERNWRPYDNALQRVRTLNQSSADLEAELQEKLEAWRLDLEELAGLLTQLTAPLNDASVPEATRQRIQALIQSLEDGPADDPLRLRSLASIYLRLGQLDRSEQYLARYRESVGDAVDGFLFEAELLTNTRDFAEAERVLQQGLDKVQGDDRQALQRAYINLELNRGDPQAAVQRLASMVQEYPDNPLWLADLARLVTTLPDLIPDAPASWESRLSEVDPSGRYRDSLKIWRLIKQVDATQDTVEQDKLLRLAASDCQRLRLANAQWPNAHALSGLVSTRQLANLESRIRSGSARDRQLISQRADLIKAAQESLQRAFALGERRSLYLRLLATLTSDPSERRQLMSQLDSRAVAGDPLLSNMNIALLNASNDPANAMLAAERAVASRRQDPLAWLALAREQVRNNALSEADESATRAQQLIAENETVSAEQKRRALRELFGFYAVDSQMYSLPEELAARWTTSARAIMEQVLPATSEAERGWEKARMLAALGDEQAVAAYRLAVAADPDNVILSEEAIRFLARQPNVDDWESTIQGARDLVQANPGISRYRSLLASLLLKRGLARDFQEVSTLLGEKDAVADNNLENQRLLAVVLLTRTNVTDDVRQQDLRKAYDLVQDSQTAQDLALGAQILAVQANFSTTSEAEEKRERASERFNQAAEAEDVTVFIMNAVITYFMEQGLLDQASGHLRKARVISGDSLPEQLQLVSLTARLEKAQGQKTQAEIVSQVEEFGRQLQQRSDLGKSRAPYYDELAKILATIEAPEAELVWLREAVRLEPGYRGRLAARLAAQDDTTQALQTAIAGYRDSGNAAFVRTLAQILLTSPSTEEHYQLVEPVFQEAINNGPRDAATLTSIANVRLAGQGQADQAIKLYQQALQVKPDDKLLLNNLATAYSDSFDTLDQALQQVDKAIRIYGKEPQLVDTRAVILMLQDQLGQAEAELKSILGGATDPRYLWHYAEVRWRQHQKTQDAEDLDQAKFYFQKARDLGLEDEVLTPGERKRLDELKQSLVDSAASIGMGAFPVVGGKVEAHRFLSCWSIRLAVGARS